ncbi:MAG: hypothetical protein ACMUEM_00080 [Flavobacteriales bacterium AspAUS03]
MNIYWAIRITFLAPDYDKKINFSHGLFNPSILIDDKIVSMWKCTVQKDKSIMEIRSFVPLDKVQDGALDEKMLHYSRFIGRTVEILRVFDP